MPSITAMRPAGTRHLGSILRSRLAASDKRSRSRQNDPKFGELAGPRIDLNRPAMLLDDDVVTDGQAQPSPFTGRLCRKGGIEQLFLRLRA